MKNYNSSGTNTVKKTMANLAGMGSAAAAGNLIGGKIAGMAGAAGISPAANAAKQQTASLWQPTAGNGGVAPGISQVGKTGNQNTVSAAGQQSGTPRRTYSRDERDTAVRNAYGARQRSVLSQEIAAALDREVELENEYVNLYDAYHKDIKMAGTIFSPYSVHHAKDLQRQIDDVVSLANANGRQMERMIKTYENSLPDQNGLQMPMGTIPTTIDQILARAKRNFRNTSAMEMILKKSLETEGFSGLSSENMQKQLKKYGAEIQTCEKENEALFKTADYWDKAYKDNFMGQTRASYTRADLEQDVIYAWSKYVENPTEANRLYAKYLETALAQFEMNNKETLADDAILPVLTQTIPGKLPEVGEKAKNWIKGVAGGAAVHFLSGRAIPPGIAMDVGTTLTNADYAKKIARGETYRIYRMNGYDDETARVAANNSASIEGALDIAGNIATGYVIGKLPMEKLLHQKTNNEFINAVTGKAIEDFLESKTIDKPVDKAKRAIKDVIMPQPEPNETDTTDWFLNGFLKAY